MIRSITYLEEEAKLIISTVSDSNRVKYSYKDIPLSLYRKVFQFYKKNLEGNIWKSLKNCDFEKEEL